MKSTFILGSVLALATAGTHASDTDPLVVAAEAAARARLQVMKETRFTVTGRPHDLALPEGVRSYEARAIEGTWPRRRFVVPVDIFVNGRRVKTAPVSFEMVISGKSLVYAADLRARAAVDGSGLRERDSDLARVHGKPVVDVASLKGMRLRRGVRAGDVALEGDFEPVPDIDVRQRVRVVATQGAIRLEGGGTALVSGNRGDSVTVRMDGGGEPVRATVIDKGVTQVVQ